jgi:hypothetical protein
LVEKAMQFSFRRDDRHSVRKRNPLLLKPGASPALMLWMPQYSSPYGPAFSNEPVAEVRSWKAAALVTALFVCGTTFLGTLHIVRQFANPAKFENAARPQIPNLLPNAHRVSAPAAGKRQESSDGMRRQFRPEQSVLPLSKREPDLVARAEGAHESHDRARRQVTLRSLSGVSDFRPALPLEDAYQFADAGRRQFRPEISILPVSKREPEVVAKVEGARQSHDRARRQVTLRLPPNLIASEQDGTFTGTISDLKPSSNAADTPNILSFLPDFHRSTPPSQSPLAAPGAPPRQPPSRRYPTPFAHNDHRPSSFRHSSTEEPTIVVNATETGSGVNSSEALVADQQTLTGPVPKPERKPKRSSRAKKVSSKKAVGQCWNRIWRC